MDIKFIIVVVIALLIGAMITAYFSGGKKSKVKDSSKESHADANYESQVTLLSAAELLFYKKLVLSVDSEYVVFSKVRISDILRTKNGLNKSQSQSAFNRICSKHVDFILCNSENMAIMAAVELDDKSHNNSKTQKRDKFVNSAFKAASVPLIRIKAQSDYSVKELQSKIEAELALISSKQNKKQDEESSADISINTTLATNQALPAK